METRKGKLNIIIDGQFGSTGKGLLSSYVAMNNDIDISITNSSPNAGHTFYNGVNKHIVKHLPVSGVMNDKNIIYLCAGSIINPKILLEEIEKYNIGVDRLFIHPRAAIITDDDIDKEKNDNSSATKISSTRSGVGSALERKINRTAELAGENKLLKNFIQPLNINEYLDFGLTCLMEVPQGFDLSISSGYKYPYCTSREITISSALSDAQVHPMFLGNTMVCIRTFPIRVGNIIKDNRIIGYSGPFYPDSKEITWDDIGVEEERTTVTNKIRRVATFSMQQYRRMIDCLRPDYILLNFANYLDSKDLKELLVKIPEVTHVSFGPRPTDIINIKNKNNY